MFKEVRNIIITDNMQSGIQSTSEHSQRWSPPPEIPADKRPQSVELSNGKNEITAMPDVQGYNGGLRSFTPPLADSTSGRPDPSQKSMLPRAARAKPPVQPKPEGLHGKVVVESGISRSENHDSAQRDVLSVRFANLRMPRHPDELSSQEPRDTRVTYLDPSVSSNRTSLPSTSARLGSSTAALIPTAYQDTTKPSGPRHMPPTFTQPPPHPPKLPLTPLSAVPLPRAPSPTYSPARNLQNPAIIHPPRSTPRSMMGTGGRSNLQATSNMSSNASGSNGEPDSYFPRGATGTTAITPAQFSSADLPSETAITAEKLYEYLRTYDILLIDVRTREEFDQGHIFATSIMCIEPLGLRPGVSAEELEERLIISPESEQILFDRRNEFDLVVYHDQNTQSSQFLLGSPSGNSAPALRALHDTIYEFNYYKELRRAPALLIGGLDAWTDLVGYQALQQSKTAALMGVTRVGRFRRGAGRPISRVPLASANSSLEVRKRRLREYDPLNAEEAKAWLETARKEGVEAPDFQQTASDSEENGEQHTIDLPMSPLVHSYEDFLRKFPEPSAIQQSMVIPRPPPSFSHHPEPRIPAAPSRPPPALPRPSYSGVSERATSQQTQSSRHSSVPPPLYISNALAPHMKLPRTGLINFSVTCYMNATIQCLLATIPLSQFFLDNRWRGFLQKNWKGSNGIMPEIYANLIRSMWKNDVQAIRPSSLRNFCARLNKEWGVDRQQDAKEFFDFLVDCLHEDLNVNWERTPLRPLTVEEELRRERTQVHIVSRTEWERYCHRESSFVSNLFAGQHASRLRCTTCRNTSTTYEAFYSISVEIPRSGKGDIHDCLRSYCQEEMLSGDEVWKCSQCKCEREATKQITITRAPQFLVIHFKRFSASKTESARKVHTPIDFPLHGLNMGPYMIPPPSPEVARQVSKLAGGDGVVDPAITPPYQYDAYGVMRHLGKSGSGGHYISLVKDSARGCWRKFDDERATDFDPHKLKPDQRLQNDQAYLVFYARSAAR